MYEVDGFTNFFLLWFFLRSSLRSLFTPFSLDFNDACIGAIYSEEGMFLFRTSQVLLAVHQSN